MSSTSMASSEAPEKTVVGIAIAGSIALSEEALEHLRRGVLDADGAKVAFTKIADLLRQALAALPNNQIDGAMLAAEKAKRDGKKRRIGSK